jgi:hypothetical protein
MAVKAFQVQLNIYFVKIRASRENKNFKISAVEKNIYSGK